MKAAILAFFLFVIGISVAGYCMISSSPGDEIKLNQDKRLQNTPDLLTSLPNEAKDAPEKLHVGDKECRLKVMAWRNNGPEATVDDRKNNLQVMLSIQDGEGKTPENTLLNKLWVINGGKVWQADLSRAGVDSPGFFMTTKPGPLWGPGISVDFIVEFTTPDNQIKRITASKKGICLTRNFAQDELRFQ